MRTPRSRKMVADATALRRKYALKRTLFHKHRYQPEIACVNLYFRLYYLVEERSAGKKGQPIMKCMVLAGGRGDRLWPLSRKNYPKQFITIQKNHSIFQETIARNIPFCDEFIIVTNKEYQFIVENQMKAFQGITYRLVLEEVGRKTTAAIILSCMQFPLSELMFVVASDHLIEGEGYKENILQAAELARKGFLITFGMPILKPDTRFGYLKYKGDQVLKFVEKPDADTARSYQEAGDYLINSGMFLFRIGDLMQELQGNFPWVYNSCQAAFFMRKVNGKHTSYSKEVLEGIEALPIEKTVFEKTKRGKVVRSTFSWQDIGSLEDLAATKLDPDKDKQVVYDCENTTVINQSSRSIVVANSLKDVTIVSTDDAVYVGKTGASDKLKDMMKENPSMQGYFDRGRVIYKPWGTYELLTVEERYVVRKVVITQGKTIYAHQHARRTEHWIIVCGKAKISLAGMEKEYGANDTIEVPENTTHQISNIGEEPLIFMEISTGLEVQERDLISVKSKDLTEAELGYHPEPFVKLLPAFKDYLWGGTRLRDVYGKKCDYDVIAESWELSAHDAGQSIVASGRYKGMLFAEYLSRIGRENWGWKCQSMRDFPLLVKLIDTRDFLSIQVHPDDDYALEKENEYGKNEMWYVLECEDDAGIYCGFKRDVTKKEVKQAIHDDTILSLLNWIPVKKGQAYFIPTGTVHAIGKGVMVCEIQQSSNCTYRLYDFNRVDKYGNRRQLHIEKALDVLNLSRYEMPKFQDETMEKEEYRVRVLSRCKYFESASCEIFGKMDFTVGENSFASFVCVRGEGTMKSGSDMLSFRAGDSIFLPKGTEKIQIEGNCEAVITHI